MLNGVFSIALAGLAFFIVPSLPLAAETTAVTPTFSGLKRWTVAAYINGDADFYATETHNNAVSFIDTQERRFSELVSLAEEHPAHTFVLFYDPKGSHNPYPLSVKHVGGLRFSIRRNNPLETLPKQARLLVYSGGKPIYEKRWNEVDVTSQETNRRFFEAVERYGTPRRLLYYDGHKIPDTPGKGYDDSHSESSFSIAQFVASRDELLLQPRFDGIILSTCLGNSTITLQHLARLAPLALVSTENLHTNGISLSFINELEKIERTQLPQLLFSTANHAQAENKRASNGLDDDHFAVVDLRQVSVLLDLLKKLRREIFLQHEAFFPFSTTDLDGAASLERIAERDIGNILGRLEREDVPRSSDAHQAIMNLRALRNTIIPHSLLRNNQLYGIAYAGDGEPVVGADPHGTAGDIVISLPHTAAMSVGYDDGSGGIIYDADAIAAFTQAFSEMLKRRSPHMPLWQAFKRELRTIHYTKEMLGQYSLDALIPKTLLAIGINSLVLCNPAKAYEPASLQRAYEAGSPPHPSLIQRIGQRMRFPDPTIAKDFPLLRLEATAFPKALAAYRQTYEMEIFALARRAVAQDFQAYLRAQGIVLSAKIAELSLFTFLLPQLAGLVSGVSPLVVELGSVLPYAIAKRLGKRLQQPRNSKITSTPAAEADSYLVGSTPEEERLRADLFSKLIASGKAATLLQALQKSVNADSLLSPLHFLPIASWESLPGQAFSRCTNPETFADGNATIRNTSSVVLKDILDELGHSALFRELLCFAEQRSLREFTNPLGIAMQKPQTAGRPHAAAFAFITPTRDDNIIVLLPTAHYKQTGSDTIVPSSKEEERQHLRLQLVANLWYVVSNPGEAAGSGFFTKPCLYKSAAIFAEKRSFDSAIIAQLLEQVLSEARVDQRPDQRVRRAWFIKQAKETAKKSQATFFASACSKDG